MLLFARLFCVVGLALAGMSPGATAALADDGPTIDLPVMLKQAKVVFNLDHIAFDGDEPIGLDFLNVMTKRFHAEKTDARIVSISHGPAGYLLLDDAAYNKVRHWHGGNPYKDQIATLMQRGVAFEECGQTMKANGWRNEELLPGVKVNTGANFRIVELVQQGFVQLQP